MMSNFFLLVKTNIMLFLGSMKIKKKGRYVIAAIILILSYGLIGLTFGGQSFLQAMMFREQQIPEVGIFTSLVMSLFLSLFISLMRASTVPTSSDAEMLLSLPISRMTVVFSKVVSQYIFDAPLVYMIMGSSVVAYTVFGGDIPSLIRGIVLTIILPLLPVTLSYFMGSFFAALQARFRNAKLFTSGILMLLIVGYMFVNFSSSGFYESISNGGAQKAKELIDVIPPISWLTHFVTDGSLIPVILTLAMILIPFYFSVQIFSIFYGRPKTGFRSKSKVVGFPVKSPRMALFDKEVKRYLNSSIYMFNTAFGPLLMLILTGVIAVMGIDKLVDSMNIPTEAMATVPSSIKAMIVSGLLCFTLSVTSTTCVSISLEGRQLWILKVNPIRTEDIFFGKSMLNIVLTVPVAILSALIIGIRIGQSIPEILLHAIALSVLGVMLSLLGLVVNLLFPRFDWENEVQIVKQSMSLTMNLLFSFILTALPFPVAFLLVGSSGLIGFYVAQIAIYGSLLGLTVLFLKTAGKRIFEAFSC